MYETLSFEEAKKRNLQTPWGYPSWNDVQAECYDWDYLHGIWWVNGPESAFVGDDGGEPEDQTLYRNWAWVSDALNTAYQEGRNSVESLGML